MMNVPGPAARGRRSGGGSFRMAPLILVLGLVVAAALLGPLLLGESGGGSLHEDNGAALRPGAAGATIGTGTTSPTTNVAAPPLSTGAPPTSTPRASTTVSPSTVTPTTGLPPTIVTPAPAASSTSVAAPETTAVGHVDVVAIQTVPPRPGIVVRVGAATLVSDNAGTIVLPEAARRGTIAFVGQTNGIGDEEVTFAGWSDGQVAPARPLGAIQGPMVQIGLVIRRRVTVIARRVGASAADLASTIGTVRLPLGQATSVVATRTVLTGFGFVAEDVTYTAVGLVIDSAVAPVAPQEFVPRADALWLVI